MTLRPLFLLAVVVLAGCTRTDNDQPKETADQFVARVDGEGVEAVPRAAQGLLAGRAHRDQLDVVVILGPVISDEEHRLAFLLASPWSAARRRQPAI